ncbi:hypothetical protein NC653_033018 [Populus alba x Populus x berolinensis]|uniref:Uncharacterized protein n=1 Tax=Populus alba x Populus x berolinensis TaxID=444605 RepID=A0AAD6LSU6_9ROSI|nr:hypothetical protein NC653_033018 [Populus alba x Populus x berolinensis]
MMRGREGGRERKVHGVVVISGTEKPQLGCRTRLHSPQSLLPSQGLDHGLLRVQVHKVSPQCGIWMSYFSSVRLDCFLEEQYAGKTSCFQSRGSMAMLMNSSEVFNYDHNFPWCDWLVYNLTKTL